MLSLLGFTARQALADDPRPGLPRGKAAAVRAPASGELEEIRRLRQEVETLSAKVERLNQAIDQLRPVGAAPSARPAGTPIPSPFREAEKTLAQYKHERAAARQEARQKIREVRSGGATALKGLQDRYTREGKLDEAVAIRDCICGLKERRMHVLPDPRMIHVDRAEPQVLYYRVTGNASGAVWGTGFYTADASLAAAAVHAGALKAGQTGVVKVTTIPQHPWLRKSR